MSEASLPTEAGTPPSTCTLYHGDCLEVMPTLTPGGVAMAFSDLPYGMLAVEWDVRLPLNIFWSSLSISCHAAANFIFTATQPLLTDLIVSNRKSFRYDLVWVKKKCSNAFHAKKRPMRKHENIAVFGATSATYNSQKVLGKIRQDIVKQKKSAFNDGNCSIYTYCNTGLKSPSTIIDVNESDTLGTATQKRRIHPTQKPVALLEWLIKTYSNSQDTILDPVSGSGTTAIAAARLGRNCILIEKDKKYFEAAHARIAKERESLGLSPPIVFH